MFNTLNFPQSVEKEKDTLGGSDVLESGLYRATIKLAYATESKNGSKGLMVKFDVHQADNTTVPFTYTFWVTNKSGDVFYQDKAGNNHYLMGFNQANTLCYGAVRKSLLDLSSEQRTIMLYDFKVKGEVPTEVYMLVELLDKEVGLAILKTRENKITFSGSEYVPTAEETFKNNIDKVFIINDQGKFITQNEFDGNLEQSFALKWAGKWSGQTQDKYKEVSDNTTTTNNAALDIG